MHPVADSTRVGRFATYMRVTRSRWAVTKFDSEETKQLVPDLTSAIRRQPGNQSFTGGMDRASGQAITVSTWDTEEHARFSPDALGDIPSRIQALGVQVEPPEIFEVTI
jgi:hypothetical protein